MINAQEYMFEIKKGNFDPVYILKGEEDYLKDLALKELIKRAVTGLPELNVLYLDGDVNLDTIDKHCQQLPMMSERRVLIVRDFRPFLDKKLIIDNNDIKAFLQNFPPQTILIFLLRGSIEATKSYNSFNRKVTLVNFQYKTGNDGVRWALSFAKTHGLMLDNYIANYIINYIKPGLSNLENEIIKLKSAVDDGTIPTRELVHEICIPSVEFKLYTIVNHIIHGNVTQSISGAETLQEEGWAFQVMISIIQKQINALLRSDEIASSSLSLKEAAKVLGVRDFVLTGARNRKGNLSKAQLRDMVKLCDRINHESRIGMVKQDYALKYLIIELARIVGK